MKTRSIKRSDADIFVSRRITGERGVALVVSLLLIAALILLATVTGKVTVSDIFRSEYDMESKRALFIAEAGVEKAKSIVKTLTFTSALDGDDDTQGTSDDGLFAAIGGTAAIDGNNYSQASFNDGTYSVRVYDNTDGDGNAAKDSDGLIYIESRGTYKNATKTLIVGVKKANLSLTDFPAAMSLIDDSDIVSAGGTANVYGEPKIPKPDNPHKDEPIDDPDATCDEKYGIATNASPANVSTTFVGGASITGTGGANPNINYDDTTFNLSKMQDIRNAFTAVADTVYGDNPGSVDLGSTASPKTVWVQGSLTLNGNVSGAGVLIVNDKLTTGGGLLYQGIILVGVCPTCPGEYEAGTGTSNIYGAMVIANPTSSNSGKTQVTLNGTVNIAYSCTAIDFASDELNGTFGVASWNQS
jgi:hypothetical protein